MSPIRNPHPGEALHFRLLRSRLGYTLCAAGARRVVRFRAVLSQHLSGASPHSLVVATDHLLRAKERVMYRLAALLFPAVVIVGLAAKVGAGPVHYSENVSNIDSFVDQQ